ncbi:hypothetical protein [Ligilactobacillus ceti]|uniref:ABM domain-containing protein n=1 Tax=Ligilactobacillus ceti DSM 22408 TaxID=1122146 RepID=A0A0R2KJW1_9LACO|nr:hypothetical protein [Ligilactobacillus ceti]KRN89640.1 hypothetical protein IV53_GL001190 [Ligilactobacillus ceti DSM 22408]
MLSRFSLTIGPASTVKYINDTHPDQKLLYFKSEDNPGRYLLLDVFDTHHVFASDLRFKTYYDNGRGTHAWDCPFFEFRYVTINKDEQIIFSSLLKRWENEENRPAGLKRTIVGFKRKRTFEYLMINAWESEEAFLAWNRDPENKMNQFTFSGGPGAFIKKYHQISKHDVQLETDATLTEDKFKQIHEEQKQEEEAWNKSWDKGWSDWATTEEDFEE